MKLRSAAAMGLSTLVGCFIAGAGSAGAGGFGRQRRGSRCACVAKWNGEADCLRIPGESKDDAPTALGRLDRVVDIATEGYPGADRLTALAVLEDGSVTRVSDKLEPLGQVHDIVSVGSTRDGFLLLGKDGHLSCVQSAFGDETKVLELPGFTDIADFAVDGDTFCALTRAGRVGCAYPPRDAYRPVCSRGPTWIPDIQSATSVGMGCATLRGGEVVCWEGDGGGDSEDSSKPTPVQSLTDAEAVSDTCAMRTNGEVQCWGLRDNGALSNGSAPARLSPVERPANADPRTRAHQGEGSGAWSLRRRRRRHLVARLRGAEERSRCLLGVRRRGLARRGEGPVDRQAGRCPLPQVTTPFL